MQFQIRDVDLARYNSMTKYPSIPTYHAMTQKGILTEEVQVPFQGPQGPVVVTEKVDGCNVRIICGPDGSVIVGSREELLWEIDDLLYNPSQGIVAGLRELVLREFTNQLGFDTVTVYYGEFYGRGVGAAAREYTTAGNTGFRLFDVATIHDYGEVLSRSPEEIARWRVHTGPSWVPWNLLADVAAAHHISVVPVLAELDAAALPCSVRDADDWLLQLQGRSACVLDEQAGGFPEGVVVRTVDRKSIAKLRREDYARAARQRR